MYNDGGKIDKINKKASIKDPLFQLYRVHIFKYTSIFAFYAHFILHSSCEEFLVRDTHFGLSEGPAHHLALTVISVVLAPCLVPGVYPLVTNELMHERTLINFKIDILFQ